MLASYSRSNVTNDFYEPLPKQAICHFNNHPLQKNGKLPSPYCDNGFAIITQYQDKTIVELNLYNLPKNMEVGFHIHELADLRGRCESLGPHYNPFNNQHGDLNGSNSHLGDLGNIVINENGECNLVIMVKFLPLNGLCSVIGRSMIIHSGKDDLGKGNNEESKKSGNSGCRISCGIIGHL